MRVDGASPRGLWKRVEEKGCGKRFLGLTGPMGRRVRKFDGPSGRGLWYRPQGDEYKVSVTELAFYVIWHDKHSADWLAVLASPFPAAPDFLRKRRKGGGASHQRGKTPKWYLKYMTRCFFPHISRFPLRGNASKRQKGVQGRASKWHSIAVLTANRRPPERSDATFLHNPWHRGPEA